MTDVSEGTGRKSDERRMADTAALGRRALDGIEVFELASQVVTHAARTLEAPFCQVVEFGADGRLHVRADVGQKRDRDGVPSPGDLGALADYALNAGHSTVFADLAAESRFTPPSDLLDRGIRSLACALVRGYRPYGLLVAGSPRPAAFTPGDGDYLQCLADVLATAVDRQDAERISLGQTAALVTTLNALTAGPDLDVFLNRTLDALIEHLGAAGASMWRYDAALDAFRPGPNRGVAALTGEQPAPTADALWDEMLRTRRPVVIESAEADERLTPEEREWWLARGARTLVLVPMLLGAEPTGLMRVHTLRRRRYRMEEMDLAQALAQQATLALQWARLADESQQIAMIQERNRMAREIHDTLAQAFTGVVIHLETAEFALDSDPPKVGTAGLHIGQARTLAREGLAEARRSVWALRPRALEEGSLPEAFDRLLRQMTTGAPIRAKFEARGIARPLPLDIEDNLLRVGQEALTNALRHAHASSVRVELAFEPEAVRLIVRDDGRGFEPEAADDGKGLGLIGMRERVERLGGQLRISSAPGAGTEVAVAAPAPTAAGAVQENAE